LRIVGGYIFYPSTEEHRARLDLSWGGEEGDGEQQSKQRSLELANGGAVAGHMDE
jgi:hypothetical protein